MPRQNSRVLAAGLLLVTFGLLLAAFGISFSRLCFCPAFGGRCGCYGGPLDYVVFYLWVYWGISLASIGAVTVLVGLSLWAVGQIQGVSLDRASGSLSMVAALLLIPITLYGAVGVFGFLSNAPICAGRTGQCNPWTSILLTLLGAGAVAMGLVDGLSLMEQRYSRFAVLGLWLEALAGASAFLVGALLSRDIDGAIYLGAPILELSLFALLFLKLNGTAQLST